MRKEFEDQLYERYPEIFSELRQSKGKGGTFRGIACGDGWFTLIDTLCAEIQFYIDQNQAPQVVATQVKEKLGTLRFYTLGSGDERTRGMAQMACAISAHTCEVCGSLAKRCEMRGIQTLCDVHRIEQEKNNSA